MITPPIDSTKIHNRKLRRIISNSDKASNTKRIKKVVKGTKVKFKKKKSKKVFQRSTLRIRKVTSEHTGTYTCAIDIKGKKYLKDFFLFVTQPSEKQCEDQHYCLNKGECWYRLPPLDEKYCKCHIDYTGQRCETMLEDTVQGVRGQCHYLTSAVIAIGTLLAFFTLIMSIALIYFLCKCFKNGRRKSNLPSEYGSFIQASSKGDTYCHIPSDDFTQPDLYLSSLTKTTDECYTNNIQESTFSEVPSVSYNERCIPNGNTKLMQSFSSNKLPKERVNDTQNGVLKLPKRHRLSAVSSATQLTDKETLSNGLDIALPETQVIYAEPNHSQPNPPVEGCNHNLNKNLPCDSHLKCDGLLETDTFNNDEHSLTSMLSSSNHSSSDSEDSYNIKLHISEEDLIVKDPAEQKPSSSGKISPKVMYSHSKVPKPDHYSMPVSERQIENPLPNKSSTQNGQALIPAVGKSASQLLINGFQTSVDSCGGEVTRDKSLPNFAF
ncbi:pro-neuregulin-2, membrane-bound isoform isoform X2 [Octopus vulgaris]|uniref:Pro-neuregulin-2, membrane-bound isoform isoform X2 n=1 Tax=Octopus vulgaris TaxID=6645 RepID=A0AA36F112_OCTVU|nr:pro-neuregulin-2, membrane-bound isoform isoform X2 [Octopus vulgaris]